MKTPFICCHRRIRGALSHGVLISGQNTRGRLEGCDIEGNKGSGIFITNGADPLVINSRCVI